MEAEKYIDILRAKQLTEDEYYALSPKELSSLEEGIDWLSPKQLFPIGETVLIRSEFVDHIDYVEGVRYQVRASQTVALMVIEKDQAQFRLQLLIDDPINAPTIKKFVYENDLALFLSRSGFNIAGYEMQNRQTYTLDDQQIDSALPTSMARILDSEQFDGEMNRRRSEWPLCENTAVILFQREDHLSDVETGRGTIETCSSRIKVEAETFAYSRFRGLKKELSYITVLLNQYMGSHRFYDFDGSKFLTWNRCSSETVNVIGRYELKFN